MLSSAEATDALECWSRIDRWMRVTSVPIPQKWLRHGMPPKSNGEIAAVVLLAYFGPGSIEKLFTTQTDVFGSGWRR